MAVLIRHPLPVAIARDIRPPSVVVFDLKSALQL
jgi:hypothetical protein